jgi:hypothetical protein
VVSNLKCHIVRALADLGIAILYAHTPQAKGRVERLFRFFQDRLIKEMRLAGITDYTQANRFLQEQFLPGITSSIPVACPIVTVLCLKR